MCLRNNDDAWGCGDLRIWYKFFSLCAKAKIGYICDLVSETVEVEWMESNSNDKHALIHWSKVSTNTKHRTCKNN